MARKKKQNAPTARPRWTFFGAHGARITVAADRFSDARDWACRSLDLETLHCISPTWDDHTVELRRNDLRLQVRTRQNGGEWTKWSETP